MALTATSTPDAISTAYRPLEWIVYSDTANIVNLLCEVSINGTAIDHLYTFPSWINTASGFHVDFEQVAKDVLGFRNLQVGGTSVLNSTQSLKVMRVDFFEEYTVSGTLVNNYPTPDLTETIRIAPVILQHDETQNLDRYINDSTVSGTGQWLTHRENDRFTAKGETEFISILTGTDLTTNVRAKYEFYSGGSLVATNTKTFPSTSAGIYHVPTGYANLSSTIEANNVDEYRVSFEANGARRSEFINYDVISRCGRRMHFINSLGGWESITLTGHEEKNHEIVRSIAEQILPVDFSTNNYGRFVKGSQANISYASFSGKVSQADVDWMLEIIESVKVFTEESGQLLPVIIGNEETNLKELSRRIGQLPIEWAYSNRRITHEG